MISKMYGFCLGVLICNTQENVKVKAFNQMDKSLKEGSNCF